MSTPETEAEQSAPPPVENPAGSDETPKPPRWRRWGLAALVWLVLVLLAGVIQGFLFEPPLQQRLCRWEPLTPTCAALGMGRLPTEEQKRDFATAQAEGTPEALIAFRDTHKDSPLDRDAERALSRCREVPTPTPVTHRLTLERSLPRPASGLEAAAEALAVEGAEKLCRPLTDSGAFRRVNVRAEREALDCDALGLCTWRGAAVCELEEMKPIPRCDPPASAQAAGSISAGSTS